MRETLTMGPKKLDEMGEIGRKVVQEHFASQVVAQQMTELYKYDCAGEGESNGNDSSSDQLEQEINKAIEEIENGDQTPTTPQQDKKDKELESQLEEQEKDSRSQRNDELEQQEEPSNWDGITW